jgi:hypothetical protein
MHADRHDEPGRRDDDPGTSSVGDRHPEVPRVGRSVTMVTMVTILWGRGSEQVATRQGWAVLPMADHSEQLAVEGSLLDP